MKSVAIYGFAPQTRDYVLESDADEVWSLNNFYNYGLPEERVTRTFEMHELWMASVYAQEERGNIAGKQYWDWLKKEHHFPIYMSKVRADFKRDLEEIKQLDIESLDASELQHWGIKLKEVEIAFDFFDKDLKATILKYPLDDIIDDVFPKIPGLDTDKFPERGVKPYFVSSIDYMSALAVYEGFDRIEYYGVELREKTEWAMQKSGATFWAGVAMGRGIEVVIPTNSVLIKAPLYGIETGAQMIPIQVPEELKRKLLLEFDRNRNMHNHFTGKYTVLVDTHKELIEDGNKDGAVKVFEKMKGVQKEADEAMVRMYLAEGGMNAMGYLINHENLKLEPLTLQSVTKMESLDEETDPEREPEHVPVPEG
jgi:hypothetical protein